MLMRQIRDLEPPDALHWGMESFEPKPPSGTDWSIDDPFTSEIREHPGFIWLHRKSEYLEAYSYFEDRIQKKRHRGWYHALLQMRFLELVAGQTGIALLNPDHQPQKLSIAEKRRAVSLANELVELMRQGNRPSNYLEMQSLEQSLNSLIDELSQSTSREYSGPNALQRAHLIALADSFRRLGLNMAEIVHLIDTISPVLGFTPNRRTVQRYVRKALSRKRQ